MRAKILDDLWKISASIEGKYYPTEFEKAIWQSVRTYEISLYGEMDTLNVPWRAPVALWDGKPASEYSREELAHHLYVTLLSVNASIREMNKPTHADRCVFEDTARAAKILEATYDKACEWPERR